MSAAPPKRWQELLGDVLSTPSSSWTASLGLRLTRRLIEKVSVLRTGQRSTQALHKLLSYFYRLLRLPKLASTDVLRERLARGATKGIFGLASVATWYAANAVRHFNTDVEPSEIHFQLGTWLVRAAAITELIRDLTTRDQPTSDSETSTTRETAEQGPQTASTMKRLAQPVIRPAWSSPQARSPPRQGPRCRQGCRITACSQRSFRHSHPHHQRLPRHGHQAKHSRPDCRRRPTPARIRMRPHPFVIDQPQRRLTPAPGRRLRPESRPSALHRVLASE